MEFDAIFIDPGIEVDIGGKAVITILMKINPDMAAVASTRDRDHDVVDNYEKYGFNCILLKPYRADEVAEAFLKAVYKKRYHFFR